MEIPVQRWEKAVEIRYSTRTYDDIPLSGEYEESIKNFIKSLNRGVEGVRAIFVKEGGDRVIKSILGSYGLIKGVNSYIAFVADEQDVKYPEKIGYTGEMCILETSSLGLGSCWISGTFKPEVVAEHINLEPHEKVIAITPVGYSSQESLIGKMMKRVVGSQKRKQLEELCPGGYKEDWPEWIRKAIQLARLAPSAINRQPWRFKVSNDEKSIIIALDNFSNLEGKRLDCGIAMLHIEIGALSCGIKGEWRYLNKPDIAIFTIL